MKWERDLIRDIRTHSAYDDVDAPPYGFASFEISNCNAHAVYQRFLSVKDRCRAILEIGVANNGDSSITNILLANKLDSTIYVGIDIKDKTHINNTSKNIHTIQNDSMNYNDNLAKIRSFGVDQFDFIFIDGWHSINHMLGDWEYTNLLSNFGIVGIHDVRIHPGPSYFIKSMNTAIWNVEENVCCTGEDWGIGFASKKTPKIAVALTGASFGKSIGARSADRDWRLTCDNIKTNVIDSFSDASVYVTTYDHDTLSELLTFYNPAKVLILPYDNSHQRTTFIESLKNLLEEDVDFIIITRFDIIFNQPIHTYNFDYSKFNFMFKEIEPYWSRDQFVSDSLFAFPKQYLQLLIDAAELEHTSPYRDRPDLHPIYRHLISHIGADNCNFLHDGTWDSSLNPFYNIVRAHL